MRNGAGAKKKTNLTGSQLVTGVAVCVGAMLCITMIFAFLISKEMIQEQRLGYCAMTVLLFSSIAGVKAGIARNREKKLYIGFLIGLIYIILLLMLTAVCFKGEYRGIWVSIMVILSGCAVSLVTGKSKKTRPKAHGSKSHRR